MLSRFALMLGATICFAGCASAIAEPASETETGSIVEAIEAGDVATARTVLQSDADQLTNKGRGGKTPLHLAAEKGSIALAALFVSHKAPLNATDDAGDAPLHLACREGNTAVATLLVSSGADVDLANKAKQSPLDIAAASAQDNVVFAMLRTTKRLNDRTPLGMSPLHWAVRKNHVAAVDLLLQRKCDVNVRGLLKETALHLAADDGRIDLAARLLAAGADVSAADDSNQTPLHAAAWGGHAEMIHLLSASSKAKPPAGPRYTPLHAAAWEGHAAAVAALLAYPIDVNAKNSDGATALHKAAWRGHGDVVRLLLENKADRDLKDAGGMTALQLAESRLKETGPVEATKFRGYGPEQVIGPPNTPRPGDQSSAWASKGADDQDEWLIVEYENAVVVAGLNIHENHSPGAVVRITGFDSGGREIELWKGGDPTARTAQMGVSNIDLKPGVKTDRLKIYIDSKSVSGWNEIDAVELIGADKSRQWVIDAQSSTTYATGPPPVSGHLKTVRLLK